jgi:hypothetical protein
MKRGLITWDKSEIPPAVFAQRIERVRRVLAERDLPALVVYSELWRSNQARFFSNFMPYFNRALLIIPRDVPVTLLCGLSPRVYGWIRSVTTIEDVRPAGNFAKPLFETAGERNWTRVGVLGLEEFPLDINKALRGGSLELVDVNPDTVFSPAVDDSELHLRRKAADITTRILDEELSKAVGLVDYRFVGALERRLRRAGMEDLIVLVTNGRTVPAPPTGIMLEQNFSVSLAVEYRGHWVRLSRTHALPSGLVPTLEVTERLDSSYPYVSGAGSITARHLEYSHNGKRLFHGDTSL